MWLIAFVWSAFVSSGGDKKQLQLILQPSSIQYLEATKACGF